MAIVIASSLLPISALATTQAVTDYCMTGGRQVTTSGLSSSTRVMQSAPTCTVTAYVHGYSELATATYASGGTITGSAAQTCAVSFTSGATIGTGTVALTGTNTIANGTTITLSVKGAFLTAPTTATLSNGTATCSGTATITTTLGGPGKANLYSDNALPTPTPLANPMTAASDASYTFYATTGYSYDYCMSAGTPAMPASRCVNDVLLMDNTSIVAQNASTTAAVSKLVLSKSDATIDSTWNAALGVSGTANSFLKLVSAGVWGQSLLTVNSPETALTYSGTDAFVLPSGMLRFSTDTGLSRTAAGTVAFGNGTAGDYTGKINYRSDGSMWRSTSYSQADPGARINACLTDVPVSLECDARAESGTISTPIVIPAAKTLRIAGSLNATALPVITATGDNTQWRSYAIRSENAQITYTGSGPAAPTPMILLGDGTAAHNPDSGVIEGPLVLDGGNKASGIKANYATGQHISGVTTVNTPVYGLWLVKGWDADIGPLNNFNLMPANTIVSGTYTSGITATCSAGQTCNLASFNNGNAGGTATVACTGTNTIAGGTVLLITNPGYGSTSAATSATASAGTAAACTGTATVSTTLGGGLGAIVLNESSKTHIHDNRIYTTNAPGIRVTGVASANVRTESNDYGSTTTPYKIPRLDQTLWGFTIENDFVEGATAGWADFGSFDDGGTTTPEIYINGLQVSSTPPTAATTLTYAVLTMGHSRVVPATTFGAGVAAVLMPGNVWDGGLTAGPPGGGHVTTIEAGSVAIDGGTITGAPNAVIFPGMSVTAKQNASFEGYQSADTHYRFQLLSSDGCLRMSDGTVSTTPQLCYGAAYQFYLTGDLHGTGHTPASVAGNGTAATDTVDIIGAPGGASSGTTGQTGGAGGAIKLSGGIGGAVAGAGGIGGAGGDITLTPGAGGTGASANGADGNVIIGRGGLKFQASGTITAYYLATHASLDLASVANGACSSQTTETITGAALGDSCIVSSGIAAEAGGFYVCNVTAANTINWQFCNMSGGAIDRASDTYTIRVIR